ncbi:MAG TPA: hypothetical protein VEC06_09020 [Paucimonas sp.]|nr:hypothetical protein [Paucimonas sp.]
MRKILVLLGILLLPALACARGLSFSEEMHGYAYYHGEYRYAHAYFRVVINDIDAWRGNQNYAATLSGTVYLDRLAGQPVTGTLQILAPASGGDGRLLTYRFAGGGLQFAGVKHVRDDVGLDLVDDMTTLRGSFAAQGQALPAIHDLLYGAAWTSELQFEWWKPAVLWDFSASFQTINTPWYEDLYVKILFLKTVLGSLARVFFPWAI